MEDFRIKKVGYMNEQLTLFNIEPQKNDVQDDLEKVKEQLHNLRRGLFGRYDKLVNELSSLQKNVQDIQAFLETDTNKKIIKLNF